MFPTECGRTDGSVPEGLPGLRELASEDVGMDGKPSQVLQGLTSSSCEVVDILGDGSRSEGSIQRNLLDASTPDACCDSTAAPTPVAITDQNLAAIRELIVPVTMSNAVVQITDLEPTASKELIVPDGETAISELKTFFDDLTALEPDTVRACDEGNRNSIGDKMPTALEPDTVHACNNLNSVEDKMSGETVQHLAVIRKRSSDAADDLAGFPPTKRFKVSLGDGLKVSRRPVTASDHLAISSDKLVTSKCEATGGPIAHYLAPRNLDRKFAVTDVSDMNQQLVYRNKDLVKQNAKLVSQHKELIKQNEAQVDKSNELEIRNHQLCETNKALSYKLEILKHLLRNPYKLGAWIQRQNKAVVDVR